MNNIFAQKIETLLSPFLGDLMTQATLATQCKKLGRTPENLSQFDLPPLAKQIERALVIFVGSNKAKDISSRIEKITL